jgi:hypothetical protein
MLSVEDLFTRHLGRIREEGGPLRPARELFHALARETHPEMIPCLGLPFAEATLRALAMRKVAAWLTECTLRLAARSVCGKNEIAPPDARMAELVAYASRVVWLVLDGKSRELWGDARGCELARAFTRFANGELAMRIEGQRDNELLGGPDSATYALFAALAVFRVEIGGAEADELAFWKGLTPDLLRTLEVYAVAYRPSASRPSFADYRHLDYRGPVGEEQLERIAARYACGVTDPKHRLGLIASRMFPGDVAARC